MLRMTLEIDTSSARLLGVLTHANGRHAFEGWLGLARALEDALAPFRHA